MASFRLAALKLKMQKYIDLCLVKAGANAILLILDIWALHGGNLINMILYSRLPLYIFNLVSHNHIFAEV